MEKQTAPSIEKAVELFDQQEYKDAFLTFVDVYQQSADSKDRQAVLQILDEAYYAPNEMELRKNYEKNVKILKKYPYSWGKQFHEFENLNVKLFPINDEIYYCYDRDKEYFQGLYDAKSPHQMRYFFKNLDKPLQVEDEDNFYNLTFLNDNVRSSDDFAGDNHIYLMYSSLEPLERLMLTCDLEPLLEQQKFVFLMGEKNWSRYPINFRKKFGINYSKLKPAPLKIEEINRIYLNQFYGYSGTDFFEGVLNGSDHVLVLNGWFFYESDKVVINTYLDYIAHPDRSVDVSNFLDLLGKHINDIKLAAWPLMVSFLPRILSNRKTAFVHEIWKAVMIAAMQASEQIEGKHYCSRISPVIFYDPHGVSCKKYYELVRHFKYPAVEATVREPIVRLIRSIEVFGIGSLEGLRSTVRSTYSHSRDIPRWLTESGFYVAKLEDLKLKPEETLHSVCKTLNIPYSEKLMVGKIGMWGVLFTNEKGEQLQGFDQRSVHRDISNMVPPQDKERLDLYYWPIHQYFRYPHAEKRKQLTPAEAKKLFSAPFYFEEVYAAKQLAYQQALNTAPPEEAEKIRQYIQERYGLKPEEIRLMLQETMVEDYLNGFNENIALPTVMFPKDKMEQNLTQAQRLYAQREQNKPAYAPIGDQQNGLKGNVYWLTGLSGAGKTTIGGLWYEKLKASGEPVVFLDGDELREAIGDDLGYTEADRRKSAMRNARLCALLARQGLTVVCCTISMFDSVREWNRANIPGYVEVYIKASMDTLRRRDQKGLYSKEKQDVAGVHFQVEEPKNPDLVLENDGKKTPEEQVQVLLNIWKGRN